MTDVLFYVQHLLGIGHVRRAALIARAMHRAGLDTVLVSGGMPVANLDIGGATFVQLPPLRARDDRFTALVDRNGQPVDEAWKTARAGRLRALYRELRPKVLLIEMFPFGRRSMRFELLPLLEVAHAARPRPQILCSLRDVLGAVRSPEKEAWMVSTFRAYFDQVLVHGDPAFIPLEHSFPRASEIAAHIRYTGYVVDGPSDGPSGTNAPSDEVIVSAGGGAVAAPLIEAAMAARPLSALATAPWRILAGGNLPEAQFEAAQGRAPQGVTLERARPDFLALLARARLSISQGGYNTVLEVLSAGVPAVIVPFAGSGETEQGSRAAALAAQGAITVLPEIDLTPTALAQAIDRAISASPRTGRLPLDLGGAEKTAQMVGQAAAIVTP